MDTFGESNREKLENPNDQTKLECFPSAEDLLLNSSEILDLENILIKIQQEFFSSQETTITIEEKGIDQVLEKIKQIIPDEQREQIKKREIIISKEKNLDDKDCLNIAIVFNRALGKLEQIKKNKQEISERLFEEGFKEDQIEEAIEKAEKYISQISELQIRMIEHKTQKSITILRKEKIQELIRDCPESEKNKWQLIGKVINDIQEAEKEKQYFERLDNQIKALDKDLKDIKELEYQRRALEGDINLTKSIRKKQEEIDEKKRAIDNSKQIIKNFLKPEEYRFLNSEKIQSLSLSKIIMIKAKIKNLREKILKDQQQIDQKIFDDIF